MRALFASCFLMSAVLGSPLDAAPVTYEFDKAHTHIGFAWNHLGFSDMRARFADFDGQLVLDEENPAASNLEVTIPISSVDTGVTKLDEHLQAPDFFDAETFPNAHFKSTKIELNGDKSAKVYGDLTIHGVTKPATMTVSLNKIGKHPVHGKKAAGFTANMVVKRTEFGVGAYAPMVSDEIEIFISTEASPVE